MTSRRVTADVRRREEERVIIRNSSNARSCEPIWTHQRGADSQSASSGLDSLAIRTRYLRGQEIYKEHSPVECWYRIESGIARRFSTRADGRRQIVDLLLPDDVFGFGARGRHHCEGQAVTDGTVDGRYPSSRLAARAPPDPR